MIDSHCHLDFKQYRGRQDEIIKNALAAGVHTMVNVGVDLQSSINSVEMAHKYDSIYATVGVHPHDATTYSDEVEEELLRLMEDRKVVAVGEIGLDFFRDFSPRNVQRKVFRRQLEIAVDRQLPVVIHTRASFRETSEIVREFSSRLAGGIFHCFPGTLAEAHKLINLGFKVSFGGKITRPGDESAKVAAEAPIEHILLETDSPYLTPVPVREKINQPANVRYIRDRLAELKNISIEEVETITDRNSQKFYRLVDVFEG